MKNKVEITDYNGIILNDKPVKAENIIVTISIKYEGKYGEEEYQIDEDTLATSRDAHEVVSQFFDVEYES